MRSDTDDEDEDDEDNNHDLTHDDPDIIFTSKNTPCRTYSSSIRARLFTSPRPAHPSSSSKPKQITTTPGLLGAGETETEADEPVRRPHSTISYQKQPTHTNQPRRLPTARIIPASPPLIPPNFLQQLLTPLLFETSRLLSIVPAVCGTFYSLYHVIHPPSSPFPDGRLPPHPIDFFVSALWVSIISTHTCSHTLIPTRQAILTGIQCLYLTTGLLTRWRLYYPPLPTLIRLLALQAICWPATHVTLAFLEHHRRPVATWAVVGTTTCCSRAVQMWVTSNLWWDAGGGASVGVGGGYWKRWGGGTWGGRRWDWREVSLKCVLPAGILYFVMAWAEVLRREWTGC
jgi:N-glycosylation protein